MTGGRSGWSFRSGLGAGTFLLVLALIGAVAVIAQPNGAPALLILEDFSATDGDGFPKGWEAQRSKDKAKQSYGVKGDQGKTYLAANKADQRVYKRIAWDPKAHSILTWRWRIQSAPEGTDLVAAVYVSLDTDLMVIPVSTKYVWSATKAKGTLEEGGLFGASEIVLRSGLQPVGEWVEERVNAYEDFKRIHGHEPAEKAWGISLLGGSGVEVDFGPLTASKP